MFPGWMILGEEIVDGQYRELINSQRAYAYAADAGVCWLDNEDDFTCPTMPQVLPDIDTTYTNPVDDDAPWYNDEDPDTVDFLGIVGLDVVGAENSTRSAAVTAALTGGGVISPLYYGPRTMVVRAMLIAKGECGLQAGLNWLRCQTRGDDAGDDCASDTLTFLDCCPCACVHTSETVPCWVDTYTELTAGPGCPESDWWPANYGDLAYGPVEADSELWCQWLVSYQELKDNGPDLTACCANVCVRPYLRQFHNVRVVQGPQVIQHPQMATNGALAVVEFTITATDSSPYTMETRVLSETSVGEGPNHNDPVSVGGFEVADPFDVGPAIKRSDLVPPPITENPKSPQSWRREQYGITLPDTMARLGDAVYRLTLQVLGPNDTGEFRISVFDSSTGIALYYPLSSYRFEFLPSGFTVTIDMRLRTIMAQSLWKSLPYRIDGFVVGLMGGPIKWDVPGDQNTPFYITVDRDPADNVPVQVEAWVASRGCG